MAENNIKDITASEVLEIERDTRGQGSSRRWMEERRKRITASNFGTICKATERRNIAKLISGLLNPRDLNTKATAHGKKYEKIVMKKLEEREQIEVRDCGLFVSQENPMLAASPDGLLGEDTVVEIKCPYTERRHNISTSNMPFLTCGPDGTITLDKKHDYYFQVQGQLHCTKRQVCKFVVYTFKDLKVIKIQRDDVFITAMIKKLLDFFHTYYEDALVDKYVYHEEHLFDF